ncbi:hypothetical protein [Paraburkholderia dilworthii]|uniref:hypothetical protein n=1 Tax=Paraburkholderia dilworthii TaxID=948106 RepID=UPI001268ADCB|nr:hypothetical protein [Paraburkholderia dilworthii]
MSGPIQETAERIISGNVMQCGYATFRIRYQAARRIPEPALIRPPAAAAAQQVVVVEDNQKVPVKICSILEVPGCRAEHAVTQTKRSRCSSARRI